MGRSYIALLTSADDAGPLQVAITNPKQSTRGQASMHMDFRFRVCVAMLAVAPLTFAHADEFDSVRYKIREVVASEDLASVAVAVSRNGRIVWEEGFGWANTEKRIAATANLPYALASISKPVTATALMILVERGLIDLDKPIEDYLGGQKLTAYIGNSRDATVRRVANHTSGLPPHVHFFYADDSVGRPPMEQSIQRYGVLTLPPGEAYGYSNFGYGLLEYAIERVSGSTYGAFVEEQVFAPLGLKQSTVGPPSGTTRSAVRYAPNGKPAPWGDTDHRGASAVFMSAHDLVRFGMFHLRGTPPGQKEILQTQTLLSMREADRVYGIGWFLTQQHGMKAFSHTGGMTGASTRLTLLPEADIAIALMANGNTGSLQTIQAAIVHALLPNTIRQDHRVRPPQELVGRWTGAIVTLDGSTEVQLVVEESGRFLVRVGRGEAIEVERVGLDKSGMLVLGDIPLDHDKREAGRQLNLALTLRENVLNGTAAVRSPRLAARDDNMSSYWTELKKTVAGL